MNESGGDVLPGFGVGKNPGSWVLDILEPVQGFTGNPEQDSIAVVQKIWDEGMDQGLGNGVWEWNIMKLAVWTSKKEQSLCMKKNSTLWSNYTMIPHHQCEQEKWVLPEVSLLLADTELQNAPMKLLLSVLAPLPGVCLSNSINVKQFVA